jgi:hypothetical protein
MRSKLKNFKVVFYASSILIVFLTACSKQTQSAQEIIIDLQKTSEASFQEFAPGSRESGWSDPESGGTWSTGNNSRLTFSIPKNSNGIIICNFIPMNSEKLEPLQIQYSLDGKVTDNLRFDRNKDQKLEIKYDQGLASDGLLNVELNMSPVVSPKSLGFEDERVLGIYMRDCNRQ